MSQPYHLRTSNLEDLTGSGPEGSLATNHLATIGEHRYADKRVTVGVPADDGVIILVCFVVFSEFLLHILLGLHGEVDVGDLEIHGGNQLDSGNVGDDTQHFRALPCVIYERSMSIIPEVSIYIDNCCLYVDLLVCESSELTMSEVT